MWADWKGVLLVCNEGTRKRAVESLNVFLFVCLLNYYFFLFFPKGHTDNQVQLVWFMWGRSCLTKLIPFYVHLVNDGKVVDVVYLDFSNPLNSVSHIILLEKLAARGLDRCTLCWIKNWLEGWAQRVVVNGVKPS